MQKFLEKLAAVFALTLMAGAVSPGNRAHAFMYGGGYASVGLGGGALAPFVGMPFYPGGGYAAATGQMGYMNGGFDPMTLYVSNAVNWNGAQPMGFSYMPPIGLSAINNSLTYHQIAPYVSQSYGAQAYGGQFGVQSYGAQFGTPYGGSARAF